MSEKFSRDNEVLEAKKIFLCGGKLPENVKINVAVLNSWKKSFELNIPTDTKILPPPEVKKAQVIYNNDFSSNYEEIENFSIRLNDFYAALKLNNFVITYFDEDCIAIILRGSQALIDDLGRRGVVPGANFMENVIGTNAVDLCLKSRENTLLLGSESYLDILRPFAFFAVPYYNSYTKKYRAQVIISYLKDYSAEKFALAAMFPHLISTMIVTKSKDMQLELARKNLKRFLKQTGRGTILVDKNQKVLSVTDFVIHTFGINEDEVIGSDFSEVFPELSYMADAIKTKKHFPIKEICLKRMEFPGQKLFYTECTPIISNTSCIGISVEIIDRKTIQRSMSNISSHKAFFLFDDILGESTSLLSVKKMGMNAALSSSNILILGESGTGKELFAQAIHNASTRAKGPFISINCAAIPKELIGSELFGYVDGSFTGAKKSGAIGKFELANAGTIFLDEIGEMPFDMQAALLRVLEERTITKIGGTVPIKIDVRVIAATNVDIQEAARSNKFRQDLYYRLSVINIKVPPLRERKEDIDPLVRHFIQQFNLTLERNVTDISQEAMEILASYRWPGNVRELRNIIESIINQKYNGIITLEDIPPDLIDSASHKALESSERIPNQTIYKEFADRLKEKEKILGLLEKLNGNRKRAAEELGISRATLYRKLNSFGIK